MARCVVFDKRTTERSSMVFVIRDWRWDWALCAPDVRLSAAIRNNKAKGANVLIRSRDTITDLTGQNEEAGLLDFDKGRSSEFSVILPA